MSITTKLQVGAGGATALNIPVLMVAGQLADMVNMLKVKPSCRQVESVTHLSSYLVDPFQLCQQHVFDAHNVESRENLRLSSECASCLIGELTVNRLNVTVTKSGVGSLVC